MPTAGHRYMRKQILGFYQHDPSELYWVVFKGRQIQALCLRADFNQHILDDPAEVWIGNDSPTKEWGDTLANDTARVPIYLKEKDELDFLLLGDFDVLSRTATVTELQHAKDSASHKRGISRVVFLKKR